MLMTKSNVSFFYNTDRNSKTVFDCFYAHIIDDIVRKDENFLRTNYLTPYCRRLSSNDPIVEIQGTVENNITFNTLRSQQITSEHLLQWSILIDVIEQYAIYLSTNDTRLDQIIFYNCSSGWFGSHCQYTFGLDILIESFGDFVVSSFNNREKFSQKFIIHICYPYLTEYYRGPGPMCLDWREICDGKIDCIGDRFGIDEEHCEELEINECKEDEYRCHNGAQCIPLEFYRDGWGSKDCLDGTDEDHYVILDESLDFKTSLKCIGLVTFPCEERTCRYPRSFSCGDGDCSQFFLTFNRLERKASLCPGTGRDFYHNRAVYMASKQLSTDCYKLLFCKLRFYNIFTDDTYNERYCLSSDWLSSNNCSQEFLSFPAEPLFFGYFQLIYSSKSLVNNIDGDVTPKYVCNDPRLCLHLPDATFQINGLVCRPFEALDVGEIIEHMYFLSADLRQTANSCLLKGNINNYTSNSSLFYCKQSHKHISKYRLIDGVDDCYDGEDEIYTDSCLLNDTRRFSCTSENKCLSPLSIGVDLPDCKDKEDKLINNRRRSVYSGLCNRVLDLFNEDIAEEEDCQLWPCYNPYTRCDGNFQCANGIDEIGCTNSNCDVNEFKCTIPGSTDYQCISQAHIYEKSLNCSAYKYGTMCRQLFYSSNLTNNNNEYFTWKDTNCLTIHHICGNQSTVNHQLVCSMTYPLAIGICHTSLLDMYSNKILCELTRIALPVGPYLFFSTSGLGYLPMIRNISSERSNNITKIKNVSMNTSIELIEYCNRGIVIFEGKSYKKICLCPPNYFGDRCQWQSQRVSLTLQIHHIGSIGKQTNFIYDIFIYLIDDKYEIIHYYEVINYIPSFDCQTKFNRYLLYPTKPKHENYSIHIDMYDKLTLNYHASWYLIISFPFLPVNRLAKQIQIPFDRSQPSLNCSLECGIHGKCFDYINSRKSFCKCYEGYSGRFCNITNEYSCSNDSICLNSSICLCPLNKFGSKCYLKHQSCQPHNPCQNNGQCVPINDHINKRDFICLCSEDYMGLYCEYKSNRIDIIFKIDIIPLVVFAHFVTAFNGKIHERITTFRKVPFDQQSITLFHKQSFHILFIEFLGNSYVTVLREKYYPSEHISADVKIDNMCVNVSKLLNSTIFNLTYFRRLKYYQLPCLENPKLKCFYDENHMCVCDENRFSNCFQFNHNMTYNCQGFNQCKNNGMCFQDNATCPKVSICMCKKCYYGSKCELTTQGFSLSLDVIFGYHIKPFVSFSKQSKAIKITAALTILMFVLGCINGLLSIITFRRKSLHDVGCGMYLLATSIISLLIMCVFTIKYWQLVVFQMNIIKNHSFIYVNCLLTDILLRSLVSSGDWLNACVAVERAFIAMKGVSFNKSKSKYIAKYVISILLLLTIVSYIHDPISRELFNDEDEERTWCIVKYSSKLKIFDRFINLFHFLLPFIINCLSALIIISEVFRRRSKTQIKSTNQTILYVEIRRHKHLLISPCVLIILSLPRLIISLMSGCMESARDPWLFVISYYISFVPPLLIFVVFVLPSKIYKDQFLAAVGKDRSTTYSK